MVGGRLRGLLWWWWARLRSIQSKAIGEQCKGECEWMDNFVHGQLPICSPLPAGWDGCWSEPRTRQRVIEAAGLGTNQVEGKTDSSVPPCQLRKYGRTDWDLEEGVAGLLLCFCLHMRPAQSRYRSRDAVRKNWRGKSMLQADALQLQHAATQATGDTGTMRFARSSGPREGRR